MSKRRLGKRERMARKKRIDERMRPVKMASCVICSEWEASKIGNRKGIFLLRPKSFVCGQCRKVNRTRSGAPIVGSECR